MIQKVKELRKQVPIAIHEAMTLLKENNGDVEKCMFLFKAKAIRFICEQTGCDELMAGKYLELEKLDMNHAVADIRTIFYDLRYEPIEGITLEKVMYADQWVNMMDEVSFGDTLCFAKMDDVIDVIERISELGDIGALLRKAKKAYDEIFLGYTDAMPLDEFVRRHQLLDLQTGFSDANSMIPLKRILIKEELIKHKRNLIKKAAEM